VVNLPISFARKKPVELKYGILLPTKHSHPLGVEIIWEDLIW